MSYHGPMDQPLEPGAPRHNVIPTAPQPPQQLIEPISPPAAPSQPVLVPSPEQVSGTVGERIHPPPAEPAREEVAPPSVDVSPLRHNELPNGMTPPNPVSPQEPAPAPSREHGTPERVPRNGTASSQMPVDPVQHYLPTKPLPNADPLHVPGMP